MIWNSLPVGFDMESYAKPLEEEKFIFQRVISKVILEHDIPSALVLILNQTSFSFASLSKYTFCLNSSTTVPIKVVGDDRQISAPFTVSATGSFLTV